MYTYIHRVENKQGAKVTTSKWNVTESGQTKGDNKLIKPTIFCVFTLHIL